MLQNAGNRLKPPKNAGNRRKPPETAGNRRKTPENTGKHRKTPENTGKCRKCPELAISLRGNKYLGGLKKPAPFSEEMNRTKIGGPRPPFPPENILPCFFLDLSLVSPNVFFCFLARTGEPGVAAASGGGLDWGGKGATILRAPPKTLLCFYIIRRAVEFLHRGG